MKVSESRINKIVKDAINEIVFGNVEHFTPYSKEEGERNRKGIGRMGNPSYEEFMRWREEGLSKGIPSKELSWEKYKQNR